jgi:hypothetical protein
VVTGFDAARGPIDDQLGHLFSALLGLGLCPEAVFETVNSAAPKP